MLNSGQLFIVSIELIGVLLYDWLCRSTFSPALVNGTMYFIGHFLNETVLSV